MFLSMIIFEIMCFGAYYDYMFSIVDLPLYSCMESYSPHLDHLLTWVSGKDSVSVVLILYLPTISPNMPGRVVDRGGDNTIASFAIHPPCVGSVDPYTIWVVSSFGLDPPDSLPMHWYSSSSSMIVKCIALIIICIGT
jgi:hypothetical protein